MRIAVGLDVSKGYSYVAIQKETESKNPKPFRVRHTKEELEVFVDKLKTLDGEIKIICEQTGSYSQPIIQFLLVNNFFVSAVNPALVKNFGADSLHSIKTDLKDSIKIAQFGLFFWNKLSETALIDPKRDVLKKCNHEREFSVKARTNANNALVSLSDLVFPGVNTFFAKTLAENKEKWVDFFQKFWHVSCVTSLSFSEFSTKYKQFCQKKNYHYSSIKAQFIYQQSQNLLATFPANNNTKRLVLKSIKRYKHTCEDVEAYNSFLIELARKLPEFKAVSEMAGVGEIQAAQLIAEIGDIRRFNSPKALIAFAGVDPGSNQSGQYNQLSNRSSKKGNKNLRKTLFLIMQNLLMHKEDDEVFRFLDKKRAEGKPYKVYMTAGSNKFLRTYFGKVNDVMKSLS